MTRHSKQEIADLLRRAGLHEAAEQAIAELPDESDLDDVAQWGLEHGITRDMLISQLGGSP